MFVDFHILNELGSPSINSNTFANRPPAGQIGRLFVSTDTFEIYRDNGTTWDLIGGPGSSTVTGTGAATQVAYWTASQAIGGSNNLWWDNTNGYLGVKTNAPTAGVNVVQTDGQAILSDFTTVAGSGNNAVAIYGRNTTNSSGYVAVLEEKTPNSASGQYPIKIMHSLSSGTAAANMATGIHFSLPDNAGTERINQLSMDTVDPAAATYSSRYRFVLRQNGSAATPFYITGTGIGVFTGTPTSALDVHSTGVIAQLNSTGTTNNSYLAFQRNGSGVWRLGDNYNGGNNQFEIHNTVLTVDALEFDAATNKSIFQAQQTYTTGLARGNYFDFNLSVAAGGTFTSPNAISALGASLDLTLAGNATIPSGARSGLDAYNTINFTGTGTLTQSQAAYLRAYSNITAGWAFAGSAIGTITHLAGMRVLFPDNSGSAVTVTNNYGLLINDQTANTGTVTYTNRWGIYQEGSSDLNYFSANTLIGTTVNSGEKLQVNGTAKATTLTDGFITISSAQINRTGSTVEMQFTGTGDVRIFGNTVYPILFQSGTGRFGLGTTSPTSKLTLDGTNGTTASQIQLVGTGVLSGYIGPSVDGLNFGTDGGGLLFRTGVTGNGSVTTGTERMRITSGGILQVGTNASVNLNAGSVLANSAIVTQGFLPSHQTSVGVLEYNAGKTAIRAYGATAGSGFMAFNVGGGGASPDAEAVRIVANGNVLIGTTTDAGYKLQVNGNVYSTGIGYINGGIVGNNSNNLYLSSNSSGGEISFWANQLNTRLMTILGGGDVGIGVSSPSAKLEVNGAIKTAAPSAGTAASWKLGSRVAATVVLSTTQYIELDVNGTLYKLAIVT